MQSVIAEKIDTYTRHPWHELSMSTVILSFLDNHRHLSSPVSIDRLNPYHPMQRPKTFRAARQVSSPYAMHEHSVSQFSRQPQSPFESRFNFPDRLNTHKLMQRPKIFRRSKWRWQIPRLLDSSHAPAGPQCFSIFSAITERN